MQTSSIDPDLTACTRVDLVSAQAALQRTRDRLAPFYLDSTETVRALDEAIQAITTELQRRSALFQHMSRV